MDFLGGLIPLSTLEYIQRNAARIAQESQHRVINH
jgi:hypothetical protein